LRRCAAAKLDRAVELAQTLAEPVVLYTFERAHAAALGRKLSAAKVPALCCTGAVTTVARDKRIQRWMAGDATALVCTMDAVRESATLTRAAAMIFVDLDWLPGKMLQCEGRIDPSRQPEADRRPARYYYLVTDGGPDEIVAERVITKIEQAQRIVGGADMSLGLRDCLAPVKASAVAEDPAAALADIGLLDLGRVVRGARNLGEFAAALFPAQASRIEVESGPLKGLPAAAGPHAAGIKALGDRGWIALGQPAPDPGHSLHLDPGCMGDGDVPPTGHTKLSGQCGLWTVGAGDITLGGNGAITTRKEAIAQLRRVADYFRRTEPHSPVAYLADKAARWGEMPLHVWLKRVIKDDATLSQMQEMLDVDEPRDEG
jgi:hypothetical protein